MGILTILAFPLMAIVQVNQQTRMILFRTNQTMITASAPLGHKNIGSIRSSVFCKCIKLHFVVMVPILHGLQCHICLHISHLKFFFGTNFQFVGTLIFQTFLEVWIQTNAIYQPYKWHLEFEISLKQYLE